MGSKEEILKSVADKSKFNTYEDIIENAKEEIFEAMELYASQDKWISVSDRLPEDLKNHFVYMVHENDLPEDEPTKEVAMYYPKRKRWDVFSGWKVIKWLDESPLPPNQSKTDN